MTQVHGASKLISRIEGHKDTMICPVCKKDMIVVERNRIELDYCTNCGGVWFDATEVDLLLASLGLAEAGGSVDRVVAEGDAKTSEKARRCPICARKMKKAFIGDRPKILIDACRRGHGLWFDGGELGQYLNEMADKPLAGPDSHRHVSDFLKQTFRARQSPGTQKP